MGLFERDTDIYRDRDALREDYQPDELVGRDEELGTYRAALQPVINGEQPNNVFLYGKTGVGKTAATRYLLSHLQADAAQYDDIDLTVVTLNCDGLTSSYQIATRLVNEFRDEGSQISTTGYPRASVYEMLWDELDACGGTVLVVLDEVDHVQDDSILYQLPRARANDNLSEAKIGIIGISNDFSFREDLSPKVRSSLCEQEIHFPAYDASDLQMILEQRVAVAFHDDVLEPGVIPLCAAYGAKDAGDARQSIDLLMKAGDLARDEETDEVSAEHVRRGRRALERGRIKEGIMGLTEHGHLVLYAVLTLAGVAISTQPGLLANGSVPSDGTVPAFVYLYAFLGAMAYAFTSVVSEPDKEFREVLRVGVRVFAALPLAAGLFLLSTFVNVARTPPVMAGMAFVTGLYIKLALKTLGGIAERLYRGFASELDEDAEDASPGPTGGRDVAPESDEERGRERRDRRPSGR